MGHAVCTPRVAAAPVAVPVGGLDQLLVGRDVAVRHQVAGTLPAEDRVAGDPPCGALEVDLPLQEVEEERRVVEPPPFAAAVGEGVAEDLVRLLHLQPVVLVGCLLVGVARRDLHDVDLEVVVQEVEHLADGLGTVHVEEGGVGGDPEAAPFGLAGGRHRLVEGAAAAHRRVVALAEPVEVDGEGEVGGGGEEVELLLQQESVGAEVDESLALHQRLDDLVDLLVHEWLTTGDGDHGCPALLGRGNRLLDGEPASQDVVGVLDLAAAGAGEVALVEGLEL